MGAQARFGCKTFSTDVAVKGSIFGPFDLSVVVSEVLLQIGELYKGSTAVWQVAFIRTFP